MAQRPLLLQLHQKLLPSSLIWTVLLSFCHQTSRINSALMFDFSSGSWKANRYKHNNLLLAAVSSSFLVVLKVCMVFQSVDDQDSLVLQRVARSSLSHIESRRFTAPCHVSELAVELYLLQLSTPLAAGGLPFLCVCLSVHTNTQEMML